MGEIPLDPECRDAWGLSAQGNLGAFTTVNNDIAFSSKELHTQNELFDAGGTRGGSPDGVRSEEGGNTDLVTGFITEVPFLRGSGSGLPRLCFMKFMWQTGLFS